MGRANALGARVRGSWEANWMGIGLEEGLSRWCARRRRLAGTSALLLAAAAVRIAALRRAAGRLVARPGLLLVLLALDPLALGRLPGRVALALGLLLVLPLGPLLLGGAVLVVAVAAVAVAVGAVAVVAMRATTGPALQQVAWHGEKAWDDGAPGCGGRAAGARGRLDRRARCAALAPPPPCGWAGARNSRGGHTCSGCMHPSWGCRQRSWGSRPAEESRQVRVGRWQPHPACAPHGCTHTRAALPLPAPRPPTWQVLARQAPVAASTTKSRFRQVAQRDASAALQVAHPLAGSCRHGSLGGVGPSSSTHCRAGSGAPREGGKGG